MTNSYESVYVNLLHVASECLGKSYLLNFRKWNTNISDKRKGSWITLFHLYTIYERAQCYEKGNEGISLGKGLNTVYRDDLITWKE